MFAGKPAPTASPSHSDPLPQQAFPEATAAVRGLMVATRGTTPFEAPGLAFIDLWGCWLT